MAIAGVCVCVCGLCAFSVDVDFGLLLIVLSILMSTASW